MPIDLSLIAEYPYGYILASVIAFIPKNVM